MSIVNITIRNHVFEQEHLESFMYLVNRPYIQVEEMIQLVIRSAWFEFQSYEKPARIVRLNSSDIIESMRYIQIRRTLVVEYPYNKIIASFPPEVINVFILKIYFQDTLNRITEMMLFIGL